MVWRLMGFLGTNEEMSLGVRSPPCMQSLGWVLVHFLYGEGNLPSMFPRQIAGLGLTLPGEQFFSVSFPCRKLLQ